MFSRSAQLWNGTFMFTYKLSGSFTNNNFPKRINTIIVNQYNYLSLLKFKYQCKLSQEWLGQDRQRLWQHISLMDVEGMGELDWGGCLSVAGRCLSLHRPDEWRTEQVGWGWLPGWMVNKMTHWAVRSTEGEMHMMFLLQYMCSLTSQQGA